MIVHLILDNLETFSVTIHQIVNTNWVNTNITDSMVRMFSIIVRI
jgi:hypothetical protein